MPDEAASQAHRKTAPSEDPSIAFRLPERTVVIPSEALPVADSEDHVAGWTGMEIPRAETESRASGGLEEGCVNPRDRSSAVRAHGCRRRNLRDDEFAGLVFHRKFLPSTVLQGEWVRLEGFGCRVHLA